MTITENQSQAEIFRSFMAQVGLTIVDDVPDDLTREQLVEVPPTPRLCGVGGFVAEVTQRGSAIHPR